MSSSERSIDRRAYNRRKEDKQILHDVSLSVDNNDIYNLPITICEVLNSIVRYSPDTAGAVANIAFFCSESLGRSMDINKVNTVDGSHFFINVCSIVNTIISKYRKYSNYKISYKNGMFVVNVIELKRFD